MRLIIIIFFFFLFFFFCYSSQVSLQRLFTLVETMMTSNSTRRTDNTTITHTLKKREEDEDLDDNMFISPSTGTGTTGTRSPGHNNNFQSVTPYNTPSPSPSPSLSGQKQQRDTQQRQKQSHASFRSSVYAPNSLDSQNHQFKIHKPLPFHSRRSPLLCLNGCVATSQPLASSIGLQILLQDGNAADAALAVAAALAVTEPCSTGLGGDMFSLYYDAKDKKVTAINGSGICPANMTLDLLKQRLPHMEKHSKFLFGINEDQFYKSVYSITVPAAARGWEEFYNKYASKKFTFLELLEPAAKLAEQGFPVSCITAQQWKLGLEQDIKKWCTQEDIINGNVPLSINGHAPKEGDIMVNTDMARVLRSLGQHGATKGFYQSFPGQAIIEAIQRHGGVMTADDLKEEHTQCTFPEPIYVEYHGVKLHQVPPNGQGIAGLIALSGLAALEDKGHIPMPQVQDNHMGWKSPQTWHAMIEMMRLGFSDARAFVCDPDFCKEMEGFKSNQFLLDQKRIAQRAERMFDSNKAVIHGVPDPGSGTVSFQVVDKEGNAVSFVNSNYAGFGTGLCPDGCGFTLQNRGNGFSLDPDHLNAMEPYKRPFHTIIPGILTYADNDDLYATLSNMGGFMQPQGHMQLTVGMVSGGLNPQEAIDMPRFFIADGTHDGEVLLEDGVDNDIVYSLKNKGHKLKAFISGFDRTQFGKAQIIKKDRHTGVLWAGSESRADGTAFGY